MEKRLTNSTAIKCSPHHGFTPTPFKTLFSFFKNNSMRVNDILIINYLRTRLFRQNKKPCLERCRGFTLVEMVIYVAFLAVLSVLAIEATMIVMKSFYTLRITNNINQSATVALERMSREIRNAYDIDTVESTLGTNPGRLTLKTKDSGGSNTTIEFYTSGNQIRIKEGGIDKGALMTKNAAATNLIFRQITTTNSKAIKIELTLHDAYGTNQKDSNFYNTIMLRGSAH